MPSPGWCRAGAGLLFALRRVLVRAFHVAPVGCGPRPSPPGRGPPGSGTRTQPARLCERLHERPRERPRELAARRCAPLLSSAPLSPAPPCSVTRHPGQDQQDAGSALARPWRDTAGRPGAPQAPRALGASHGAGEQLPSRLASSWHTADLQLQLRRGVQLGVAPARTPRGSPTPLAAGTQLHSASQCFAVLRRAQQQITAAPLLLLLPPQQPACPLPPLQQSWQRVFT